MSNAQAPRIRGVLSPVLTPFTANYTPDTAGFIRHCKWLIRSGVGLAYFGTNSEANSLSVAERLGLMEALLASGIEPARMMPGTGCCALTDSVELTRAAVSAGCAGVLMLPPFYYKGMPDEGLFRNYAEIIQRVGDSRLRIYLYHIPPVAQVPLSFKLIERLITAYPGVIAGIKDSSGDWSNTEGLLKNFQSEQFDVFCGSETFLLQTLRGGGCGCITATGNVNPAPIVELYNTWKDPGADGKQARLTATRGAFPVPMIPSMKACIAWKRNEPAWATVRPPHVETSPEKVAEMKTNLDKLGFAMPGIA